MKERSVDLPAPLGPMSAVMPPSGMSRLTLLRMGLLPMWKLTLRMVIMMGVMCGFVFRRPPNMRGRLKRMGFRFRER